MFYVNVENLCNVSLFYVEGVRFLDLRSTLGSGYFAYIARQMPSVDRFGFYWVDVIFCFVYLNLYAA